MQKNQYVSYLDLANVVSAIAVVILHANGSFWLLEKAKDFWPISNVIESLFYFCVPIFFMISGITLIDYNKRYTLKEYFKKRINKVVIPYIFWSFFAIAYNIFFTGTIKTYDLTWTLIINKLLSGTSMEIYWFFIPLFYIYLAIPLFAMINDKYKKSIFIYYAIICFIFYALIPFIINIINLQIEYIFNVNVGIKNTIFIAIGYLIHNYKINPKLKYLFYFLSIIALLMHIIGTYVLSMEANMVITTYKGFSSTIGILYATGIFLFLKDNGEKIMQNKMIFSLVNFLRKYTFGIYLLHIYFLKTTSKLFIVNPASWQWVTIMTFVAIIGSIIVIFIFRQIPIFKKLLP